MPNPFNQSAHEDRERERFMTTILPQSNWTPGGEGIYSLPFDTYLSAPGVSKSALDKLARCPREFKLWRDGVLQDEPTQAMTMGKLLDALLLEREANFHIRPDLRDGGKPWHAGATECRAWAECHADKPIVSEAEAKQLMASAQYVRSHPKAGSLLADGLAQVSLFARDLDRGLLLKGRPDFVNFGKRYWLDVKRVADASTEALSRQIVKFRWHVQAAMYRRLFRLLDVPMEKFYIVAVDACDWGNVNVRELRGGSIDIGEFALDDNLDTLVTCEESGFWPDYSGVSNEIEGLTLPAYAYKQTGPDEITVGGATIPL